MNVPVPISFSRGHLWLGESMIEWNGRRVKTRRILLTVFIGLALSHTVVGGLALSSSEEVLNKVSNQNSVTEWALIRAQSEAAQLRAQLQAAESELQQSQSELEETRVRQVLLQSSSANPSLQFYRPFSNTEVDRIPTKFYTSWNEWCECLTKPNSSISRHLPNTCSHRDRGCPVCKPHQQIFKVCMIGSDCDGQ